MQSYYDSQAEERENTKVKDLYKVGMKVRLRVQQSKGQTKFSYRPYSQEIYTIKEVRPNTRSYLIELSRAGRQNLRILAHHRRVKRIFEETLFSDSRKPQNDTVAQIEPPSAPEPQNAQNEEISCVNPPIPIRTRTGRISKKPKHLQDFS